MSVTRSKIIGEGVEDGSLGFGVREARATDGSVVVVETCDNIAGGTVEDARSRGEGGDGRGSRRGVKEGGDNGGGLGAVDKPGTVGRGGTGRGGSGRGRTESGVSMEDSRDGGIRRRGRSGVGEGGHGRVEGSLGIREATLSYNTLRGLEMRKGARMCNVSTLSMGPPRKEGGGVEGEAVGHSTLTPGREGLPSREEKGKGGRDSLTPGSMGGEGSTGKEGEAKGVMVAMRGIQDLS